ncbi:glycosyltransferase family 2 protein [Streptomyces genisteinicus]|uniref:Glycosyltransferase family 2 protein n=1 Tax=Streptomyces genisteinicus TaxID=2768068 RepID=A0A7H0HQW7_9ACTN|nr:glycosyltransferase family 2 protein [Streptomyces genisteinicus]QNP62933.1 glycosyltransferase family 2 protein [Streptomyces genisteinicus]
MNTLSIVMPALNEAPNLPRVMATMPLERLRADGWDTEVLVVDNASTDGTGDVARSLGARVVEQPARGYGNAYHAGFAAAEGDVIATGDADCTYPFDALPYLLRILVAQDVEFMTTDRLGRANRHAMCLSHRIGNHVLSAMSRGLFRNGLHDSQSGMWIFRRRIWRDLDVRATGMVFSQEIKNSATLSGYRCLEVPIEYRKRAGEVKLHALRDGTAEILQLIEHRIRSTARRTPAPARGPAPAAAGQRAQGRAA